MKIIIKTKNLSLTPSLEQYINEKIGSLEKFVNTSEIFVEIEKETKHHRHGDVFVAKAQIDLTGKSLIAESKGDDLLLAIVGVKDEMQQEIKKYKTKKIDSLKTGGRKAKEQIKNEL